MAPLLSLISQALALAALVRGAASTSLSDSWRDADVGQSGYVGGGHGLDPAVVDSAQFKELWASHFGKTEKHYAKPLVYTLSAGQQVLFLASTANIIRTIDAKTGELLNYRQVAEPFPLAEVYCTGIADTLGIMGTPVIDPETDIAYFYAKSYIPNYRIEGETGILNGVYYFYAVHLDTLDDVEGFPILVDGVPADNDKRKYFIGGTILNRPSLTQIGDVVYAGFGSICDQFNYTGTVLAVNVKEKKLVNNFVTQAGLDSAFTLDWTMFHAGGGAGIWQSGMGLSSDGKSLYFVVDNGDWPGNVTEQTAPVAGGTELDVLSEMAVRLEVGEDGFLEVVDHFQPFDFQNDEGMDLGSGGISLLDPEVFHGGDIERMALVAGKSGKIYVLDADNLGGFRQGPNETDGVVQIIDSDGEGRQNGAVYGGLGSYPLDGGYVYSAGVGQPIKAYKLITSEYGTPHFEVAGKSVEVSQDTLGNGIPTVTSFGDAEGSGIVWLTAPLAGLQAWHAIPDEDGMLKTINLPRIDGSIKFSRPTFGDGRVYVFDSKGVLHCLGSN